MEAVALYLDPFYRAENGDTEEQSIGVAYKVWENPLNRKYAKTTKRTSTTTCDEGDSVTNLNKIENDSSEKSNDEDNNTTSPCCESDDLEQSESETEVEINELIENIRSKKKKGLSLTGETLWYDESKGVIRNLHTCSYSLTSYIPPDHNLFGKNKKILDLLEPNDIKMLQVCCDKEVGENDLPQAL